MRYLLLIFLLTGCTATADRYILKDDEMVLTERLKLKGYGSKSATFEGGSGIERSDPLKTPDAIFR